MAVAVEPEVRSRSDPVLITLMERDDDSDTPEELTIQQGIKQDEEIQKVHRESMTRVAREGKERRRQWAQRKTQQKIKGDTAIEVSMKETPQEAENAFDVLPSDVVNLLVSREKKVFHSDDEEETANDEPTLKKKKLIVSGEKTVLLKDIPPAQWLYNSMDFLKKRKMNVPRSASVLKNSNQALRLLSARGLLK